MKYYYHKYRTSTGIKTKNGRTHRTRSGKPVMNYSKWRELLKGSKFEDFNSAVDSVRKVGQVLHRQDAVVFGGKVLLTSQDLAYLTKKQIAEIGCDTAIAEVRS